MGTLWCELLPIDVAAGAAGVLAAISFGRTEPHSLATIPLPQLGASPLAEVWRTDGPVTLGTHGPVQFARTDDVLLGVLARDAAMPEAAGEWAFDAIIDAARESGHPHLLRIWSHLGSINAVTGATERYRAFCAGRYESFRRHGYALRTDLPAASAVGIEGSDYAAYFIASRVPARQIENPRQVSAYDYPPRYGRRSPSFSRATLLELDGGALLFLSGTASIVGHETLHAGDPAAQTDETIRNLEAVLRAAGGSPADMTALKVYVRHAADAAEVERRLRAAFGATPQLVLRADICRADLLVEVEGVARLG